MTFAETGLSGLVLIELEPLADERGSFARTFDAAKWEAHGIPSTVVQCSVSRNHRQGTLRGMHYQAEPHGETKLVRCGRGAIFDVAVDLRPDSTTFRRWFGEELSETNGRMLHIPAGFAHGFLTLADESEVVYQMADPYVADAARGLRYDDPAFAIQWPAAPVVISDRDRTYPDFAA
ncbi:MAG TPA: dTDP-4-dehydrorhamnose 3,5-epimerase [Plantibacter sp.]|uniref:dTDP-4-dehydrorhamnose 3,5-epimerase n=1 Tax=Plantibacter sp. TaxID=1871045 RepID=UPI002C010599|nr:dTDP-4-dehydrorhamnose 3,5-epimerase [Plantibacter sp.]